MFGIKKLRERVNAQSKIQTEQGRNISALMTQRYKVISDYSDLWREHNILKTKVNAQSLIVNEQSEIIDEQSEINYTERRDINALNLKCSSLDSSIGELKENLTKLDRDMCELFELEIDSIKNELDDIRDVIDSSNKATAEGLSTHHRIYEMLLWGVKNPPKYKEGDKCKYGEVVATNILKDVDGDFSWEYTAKNSEGAVTVF